MDRKEMYRKNLINFFNEEILFLGKKEWQKQLWNSGGPHFQQRMERFFIAWDPVVEFRSDANLTDRQFDMLIKLRDLLRDYCIEEVYPERPHEYSALFANPKWKTIQQLANTIYTTINPTV